jgi:hypothetical protein
MEAASRNNGDASMARIPLRFILAKIWEHSKGKFPGPENCAVAVPEQSINSNLRL